MIPLFITNLIDGLPVPLYGDGLNVRDWLHVEDHCRAIELVVRQGSSGEIYNIGGGTELTNLGLTQKLLSMFDKDESFINRVPDRLGHDRRYSVDWSKIHTQLNYRPLRSIDIDLEDLVDWYRNNEQWWRPLKR
jgi:dTDP-glucose 4,6-dehydratase